MTKNPAELAALPVTYSRECQIRTSTVGKILGGEAFVASVAASGPFYCRCRSRGWWDANDMELSAAYSVLADALENG